MNTNENKNGITEFMLSEYDSLSQNIMHLENNLFNHLSFYTTLFLAIVTASIAILQLAKDTSSSLSQPTILALLSVLFGLFVIVGRFELRMTSELRIRKMKFVEGITQIRKYFVDKDKSISNYLTLPVGLEKAPPYLRVRSKDWYQVIYISFMNGLAAFLAWICPLWLLSTMVIQLFGVPIGWILAVLVVLTWVFIGAVLFYIVFWKFSYRSVMDNCKNYDERREKAMGQKSQYDLLKPRLPKSRLEWSFGDWMASIEERKRKDA